MSPDPTGWPKDAEALESFQRGEQELAREDEQLKDLDEEIRKAKAKGQRVLKIEGEEISRGEVTPSSPATAGRARWKGFLALGVVLLLLGLASAGAATLLQLTSLLVFGPLLLTSSIVQLLIAILVEKGKERFLHLAAAGLEAVLGYLVMARPDLGVANLVVVVAAFLLVIGLLRLVHSRVTNAPGRNWIFLAGGAALVLGICVWLQVPGAGLWFVGLCLALDFVCHGVSWSALALAQRKPLEESLG